MLACKGERAYFIIKRGLNSLQKSFKGKSHLLVLLITEGTHLRP